MAIGFACVASIAELSSLLIQKFAFAALRAWSPEAMWMAPVAWSALFLLAGAALWAASLVFPRFRSRPVVAGVFTAIAVVALLFTLPLHRGGSLLLAIGSGIQAGRLARRPGGPAARAAGRVALPTLIVTVLIGLTFALHPIIRERLSLARLPTARPDAPNVVFLILDTVRSLSASVNGYERPTTPGLERIAQRGTRFARAVAAGPYTIPGHIAMFSGRFPHEFAFEWERNRDVPLEPDQAVLSEVLAQNGYRTTAFVANLGLGTWEFGLDRGFARYEDFPIHAGQFVLSTSIGRVLASNGRWRSLLDYQQPLNRRFAEDITDDFLGWLDRRGDRPFFAFLNYFDAHEPYLPPDPFRGRFGEDGPPPALIHFANGAQRWAQRDVEPGEVQRQLNAYEASIAYTDHHIARLVDALEERGLLDNTILVIASDHGEMFGEHRLLAHVGALYMTTLHVPFLLIYPPSVPAGLVVESPVSMADLPATVHELAGLAGPAPFPGRSLSRTWHASPQADAEPILSEHTPDVGLKSMVLGRYHLIRFYGARERPDELYDWFDDPLELNNLAGNSALQSVRAVLRTALDSVVAANAWLEAGLRSGGFPMTVPDTLIP